MSATDNSKTPRTDELERRLLGGKDGSRPLSAALEHARKLELQLAEAWKRVDAEIAFNEELIEENRKLCEQEPLYTSPRPETLATDYKALYHELLFAVESKWPNETRHQTALRYIQRAEREEPK